MLSDDEIVRRLRAIRFSPASDRYGRRALSINAIAKQAGLSRNALYEAITSGRIYPASRQKLAFAFSCHPKR